MGVCRDRAQGLRTLVARPFRAVVCPSAMQGGKVAPGCAMMVRCEWSSSFLWVLKAQREVPFVSQDQCPQSSFPQEVTEG